MSDSVEDIVRSYREDVCKEQEHPRSIGLFTIPEYPELEAEGGMWSSALDTILTTLRYLAPATLITIFWGQQSFLFRILKYIDSAFRSIVFSSEEQTQAVLQWLAEAGPVRVEHLDTVWRHGWILCGVLDAALPGACAGHPPTRLSIKHAQAIADHYLGVEPVFSRQELESNDSLSRHQEWRFATYLDRIRQALSKLTPAVSKPASQRMSPETNQFILDYVAKGSGLSAIQINNKAHFKIYPTAQQSLDPGDITILIRGPKDTYGMVVIPPVLGKAQMIRHKLLGLQSKQTYTENVLPLTHGATYMRNYGKNDMNKTYYIPKIQYDIEIDVDSRTEHVKISYAVKLEGKYLVSITSRGQSIVGSPFSVTASNDIISILEKDNFCLEDGEEIDIVDVKTDRKIVLRIVDFVTEKMLLKENGTLEKISDDDAKVLMTTDNDNENDNFSFDISTKNISNINDNLTNRKFYKTARKFITMQKVCKVFNDLIIQKQLKLKKKKTDIKLPSRNQKGIPDIINSTLAETNAIPHVQSEKREKFIVPERISVSLRSEISKTRYGKIVDNIPSDADNVSINNPNTYYTDFTPDSLEITNSAADHLNDNISDPKMISTTVNNPFLNEMFEENRVATHKYGTFVASEYETNNSQSEETRDNSIKITLDRNSTQNPNITNKSTNQDPLVNKNPFIETNVDFERPKTPVFKIISGEKLNRDESVYINSNAKSDINEELGNEFINPFFTHQLETKYFDEAPITDFIIGAPVSLPPLIRATSPEPEMSSLILNENKNMCEENIMDNSQQEDMIDTVKKAIFLTPLQNKTNSLNQNTKDNSAISYTFHSLDSSLTDTIDNCNTSTTSDSQFEHDHSDSDRNVTPRRDTWDSAYVSIDDNNSSPDSNNNENTTISESLSKQKSCQSDESDGFNQEEISKMGPAEREIWQTCNELKCDVNKPQDDMRPYKWEPKRPIFTPIMEESDRSLSFGTKDTSKIGLTTSLKETDTVSVAFAELDDMYQDMYFSNSEINSTTLTDEENKLHKTEQTKATSVYSASETTDVKRHDEELEGTISEVQVNATESVSVSQTLRGKYDHLNYDKGNKVKTQFGETRCGNLVLEKKKFWDEKIREIEAKSELTTVVPKKRRVFSKHLKHDSLSKRRGKQMIKNFLSSGDYSQVNDVHLDSDKVTSKKIDQPEVPEGNQMETPLQANQKLVEKWKKFWDDKLEVDQTESEICQKSPQCKTPVHLLQCRKTGKGPIDIPKDLEIKDSKEDSAEVPNYHQETIKHELSEEVFRAFETSPKRFFGTSRKQIMHKIDTFLGKPAEINISTADITTCHESGLVSSRISLFHNLSNTEELSWSRRKCQSLYNISQKKENEKSITYTEDFPNIDETKYTKRKSSKPKNSTSNTCGIEIKDLETKRATMMKNSNNNTFDEIDNERTLHQENTVTEKKYFNRTIENVHSKHQFISPNIENLRKKSFSKSEMDIFNKCPSDATDALDKYQSCDKLPQVNVKNFISLYETVSKSAENSKAKRAYRTNSADSEKSLFNGMNSNAVNKNNYIAEQASISNNELNSTNPKEITTNLWISKTSAIVSNISLDTKICDSYYTEDVTNDNKETMYLSLSDIELEIIDSPEKSCEPTPEKTIEPAHIEYKNRFKLVKEYFKSLEELREINKPRKLNECELLLRKQSTESLENERPQQRVKKNIKSRSLSSSEIAKGWKQLHERHERSVSEECSNSKLVKISEKFNVDDLYTDVTEGKLSRQGSLRGIPHKKAVLEAFRSMENVADIPMTTYDITDHLTDFDKHRTVKNPQTHLKEYPYLPTTDPSKFHSRVDIKASGLISLKELKERNLRRNSVPDV